MNAIPDEDAVLKDFSTLITVLGETDAAHVRDIVEHREYGDAYENLAALLNRGGHVVTTEQAAALGRLGLRFRQTPDAGPAPSAQP